MNEAIGPRRVVAGLDGQGRSAVVADGAVAALELANMRIAHVWTGALDAKADSQAPVESASAAFSFGQLAEPAYAMMFAEYGPGMGREDPGMHFTNTTAHFYVIEGEVVLVLEAGEVTLPAGDTGVMRGVVHGWRNDGAETARVVTFVLPATPVVPA